MGVVRLVMGNLTQIVLVASAAPASLEGVGGAGSWLNRVATVLPPGSNAFDSTVIGIQVHVG